MNHAVGKGDKYLVLKLQPDGDYAIDKSKTYFVLSSTDPNSLEAMRAYAESARKSGEDAFAGDVEEYARKMFSK